MKTGIGARIGAEGTKTGAGNGAGAGRALPLAAAALAAVIAAALPAAANAAPAGGEGVRRIVVSGLGEVRAMPDMATLTLGVTGQGREAGAVMASVSATAARILARLAELGIDARDMQTRDLRLDPVWSDNTRDGRAETIGYRASNLIAVRVRDLAALGRILDAAAAVGGNRFQGLSFALQAPAPLEERARRAAVADAMARAAVLADAAGLRLGRVIEIREGGTAVPVRALAAAAPMRAGSPVARGEITVSASVTMIFEIGE